MLLFSLWGLEVDSVGALLWGLSVLVGFVVGSGLKHSFKIAILLVGIAGAGLLVGSLFVSSNIAGLGNILGFINPVAWLTSLFNWVGTSVVAICFAVGLVLGIWKG